MSYNAQTSPNVVKTALDDVYYQEYNQESHPQYASAETPAVFNQDTADNAAVIMELFKGVGAWEQRSEEQEVPQGSPRVTNQKTFSVLNFSKSIDISKNFFDDNMHGAYEKMVRNFARRARTSRDKNAFATFRNALTTTLTSDGVALVSDSHVSLSGTTVDNKVTGALSETTLNTAIVQLLEMKSQDDEVDGTLAKVLLVPPALFKSAAEITESVLRSGTANNDMNVYSVKYGIMVYTSPYLGAAAGGSDAAWFLLSDAHSVTRWVRQSVETTLVPWQNQRNNNYIYKGEFREVVGAMNYEGLVGSSGS